MRKFLIVMTPIFVLGLGIAGFIILQATQPKPEKTEAPVLRPVTLAVATVRQEPTTLLVQTQGTVESQTEIDLIPQVSGRIVHVAPAFAGGGIFKANETLIQIESENYEFAVTQAEARVADAELVLAQEEARAAVARKQWDWDEITDKPTDLALKVPHVAQARANLASAKAQLDRAKLDLARTRISVPFSGRVREKSAGVGQYVSVGTRLGRVFSTEVVEVRLPLTDEEFTELNVPVAYAASDYETAPKVALKSQLAGRSHRWEGRIVRTDAAIDQDTRLLHAIAQIRDPYGAGGSNGTPLPVGLFVTGEIEGRTLENALIIPRAALRGKDQVYVVRDDNTLTIRTVDVVSANEDRVILASGVSAGEKIVTSPVRNAREGMAVETLESRAEAPKVAEAVN
ncbi:membrane protein [Iodidimonas gelatinilytica]|uniref:Membrane protein n=1 Tax=Iodidimonas gelatinilytica TaxID=1236966 RepID=A0A5A7N1F3_9PROT|nr:efflux RND transporter periplasmic adaptor subunit [Iodidimonas gelatinilytica]GER00979.1 membrane protein [Iodidimonas gelatinilytica]